MSDQPHIYVYAVSTDARQAYVYYERTVIGEARAKERVRELMARGTQAFYTVGKPLMGAFY